MTMEYGTITGRLVAAVADTPDDPDVNPDIVPITGTVTFTPSVKAILVASESVTVVPAPIVASLDANGYVSLNGVQGVTVLATNSTYYNPNGWTYRVSFDNLAANGRRVTFDPYNIEVPVGATVDLSSVTPITGSTGTPIVRGPKGDKGDQGPQGNPGPSDTQVATYFTSPSSTRTAADGRYRAPATDNVVYVSTSGVDTADGIGPGTAKRTIQSAIDSLSTAGKHGVVRVGAGVYTEEITLRDGISIIGAGSNMSTIKAPVGSSAKGLIQLAAGPVTGMLFQGFRVEGSGNAGQHGIYAYGVARPAPAYGDAGWWYSRIVDIAVVNFLGSPMWLRGGGSTYLLPHQFLVFEMVRLFTSVASNKPALIVSGQVGQIDWIQCEFDSNDHPPYGSTMNVPNIYICPQLKDDGTFGDEENPYAMTFHTPTIQFGWKAVYATHPSQTEFINPHLEGFKFGFHADSGAGILLRGGGVSNVGGQGGGTGYWTNTTIGGMVAAYNLRGGGSKDKAHISDGNIGSYHDIRDSISKTLGPGETSNLTKQTGVQADGSVPMQSNRTVICSTSTTSITSITSSAAPGESIFIEAFSGPLTFATGGGIQLGGKSSIVIPERGVAQFVKLDILSSWAYVGNAPMAPNAWTAVSAFTNSWTSSGGTYSPVQYRLSANGSEVELGGVLASGAAGTVAFILPAGFRPSKVKALSAYSIGNGGGRGVQVGTDGNVTILTGTTPPISLDGVRFPIDG
jgi:hypothetical protein